MRPLIVPMLTVSVLGGCAAHEAAAADKNRGAREPDRSSRNSRQTTSAGPSRDRDDLERDFLELARQEAAAYKLQLADQPVALALKEEPLLRWSNPVAGQLYGAVFLWTTDGRPRAVASIYKWYSPFTHGNVEFHSLAEGPLRAAKNGRPPSWRPARAGIRFQPLPGAPVPAQSSPARLVQMRALARRFSVDKTDREGSHRKLRLLTQPIYRYGDGEGEPADGALFAFVQGTDPEVLLQIESRRDGNGPRWHYALARMNSVTLRAFYNEKQVWSVSTLPWGKVRDAREPYCARRWEPAGQQEND